MDENMKQFFKIYPGTAPLNVKGDYRCSVHYNNFRLEKAKEQGSLPIVGVNKIIKYVNDFLISIGMNKEDSPRRNLHQIDYEEIKEDKKLKCEQDIIWMKFTTKGYLGVVATSNDINFNIPENKSEYNLKEWKYNEYKREKYLDWKYNSSGILVHQLNQKWDTSFVLVFPLSNFPEGYKRGDIERAVGNYLIDKKVSIIDFYSHNY